MVGVSNENGPTSRSNREYPNSPNSHQQQPTTRTWGFKSGCRTYLDHLRIDVKLDTKRNVAASREQFQCMYR